MLVSGSVPAGRDLCSIRLPAVSKGIGTGSTVPPRGVHDGPVVGQVPTGVRPRVVLLGKAGLKSTTPGDLDRKFSILSRHFDAVVVGAGPAGMRRRSGVRTFGVPPHLFYLCGPQLAVALAALRPGTAITCQSPYEGFQAVLAARLLPPRIRPLVGVDVAGDWRTATRLYGRPVRRVLAPLMDRCAEWTVAHSDFVRAISDYTELLVRDAGYEGQVARLTMFSDVGQFLGPTVRIPAEPRVSYVGALEPTKAVDVLIASWPEILRRIPDAELVIAGDGSLRDSLADAAARLGVAPSVRFLGALSRPAVARLLDDSSLLVLPSRSEGLGRVVMEAHARGRPAVGTRVGGIPEQIEDGVTGVLVPPEDSAALADAVAGLLADRDRLAGMGNTAHRRVMGRDPIDQYEEHVSEFAHRIGALSAAR